MPKAQTTRLVVAGCAMLALLSPSPEAQQPTPPTFRSGVDLISIDVTVVDGAGAPVPTLEASDFSVEVDGAPRAVVAVQFFEGAAPVVPDGRHREPIGAAMASSADAAANQIVFAIDVGATSPESREQVLATANAVLDRLPPADRVAAVTIPLRLSELAFTTNRQIVRAALHDLGGWSPRPGRQLPFGVVEALGMDRREREWERAVERVCDRGDPFMRDACRSGMESDARGLVAEANARAATSTAGLEALLRVLARTDGPKTVLYFSEELATDGARIEIGRVARAAAAARTSIHVMHAQPSAGDAASSFLRFEPVKERQRQLEGLELVSDWTGGRLFTLGAHAEVATRLARELSGRYLLLVETAPTDRDGKAHAIKVRVPNTRSTVRARREFVANNLRTVSTAPAASEPAAPGAAPVPAAAEPVTPVDGPASAAARGKIPVPAV
ncbi:MAG: VWA domain-containing protein, partial [Acidobacteriota bacterium]|nr:VWA domain-containing protein [Acidobacteriota bacterium]